MPRDGRASSATIGVPGRFICQQPRKLLEVLDQQGFQEGAEAGERRRKPVCSHRLKGDSRASTRQPNAAPVQWSCGSVEATSCSWVFWESCLEEVRSELELHGKMKK